MTCKSVHNIIFLPDEIDETELTVKPLEAEIEIDAKIATNIERNFFIHKYAYIDLP
jgi:hypothetical protein